MRVDVEESAPRSKTSAGTLLIARERNVYHVLLVSPQLICSVGHILSIIVIRSEMCSFVRYRCEFYIKYRLASARSQTVKETVGIHLLHVFFRHGHGYAIYDAFFMELVHLLHDSIVNAFTSSCVGLIALALYAYDRYNIAALFKECKMLVSHEGSVGKYREHDVPHLSCRLNDIPSQHWLAACKQYEADAKLFSFSEYLDPFLFGELQGWSTVCCSIIGT